MAKAKKNNLKMIKRRSNTIIPWLRLNWVLVIILVLGLYLRIENVGASYYYADGFIQDAYTLVDSHKIPLLGTEVSGMLDNAQKGPFLSYLYAIPMLISKTPQAVIIFSGILNTIGLLLCYILANKMFGKNSALLATALASVSIFQIYHSRILDVMPVLFFFVITFYLSAYMAFVEKKEKMVSVVMASLACLLQIHILAGILVITSLLMYLIFRPKVRMLTVAAGAAVSIVLYLPFLYYELSHQFQNTLNTFKLFTLNTGAKLSQENIGIITDQFFFFSSKMDTTRIYQVREFLNPTIRFAYDFASLTEDWLFLISAAAILILCLFTVLWLKNSKPQTKWLAGQGRLKEVILFLVIWVTVPMLFFLIMKSSIHHRYYLYIFPITMIFAGASVYAVEKTIANKTARNRIFVIIASVAGLIVIIQAITSIHVNQTIIQQGFVQGDIPLEQKAELVEFIVQNLSGNHEMFKTRFHDTGVLASWKGGFDILFLNQEQNIRKPRINPEEDAVGKYHYLILRKNETSRLISKRVVYTKLYTFRTFDILEYMPSLDYTTWLITGTTPSKNSSEPAKAIFPFYGNREISEIAFEGPLFLEHATDVAEVRITTRSCIDKLIINELVFFDGNCSYEIKMVETGSFTYNFTLQNATSIGQNKIGIKIVNTHKFFDVDIYDLVFSSDIVPIQNSN